MPIEVAFDGRPGVVIGAPLSVREAGFSLHAATRAGAADEQGREARLLYILRSPLATERLLSGPDGLVRIALKKPFSDCTVAVDLDPLSLLCRLVALVPAPRFHLPNLVLLGVWHNPARGARPCASVSYGPVLGRARCRLQVAASHRAKARADRRDRPSAPERPTSPFAAAPL